MTSEAGADVANRIREYVRSRFPLASGTDFADDDSLLDAGVIDSLGILDLVAYLEESFAISVSDEDLDPENFDSVHALVAFVEGKRG